MFDPLTIIAAIAPLFVDAGKAAVQKWMAPDVFKPTKIEDYISMKKMDLEMFKAMNDAGGSNQSYPWVEAVVRLMRPMVALAVMATWATMKLNGTGTESVDNFAAAIGFYLFGDRTLFYSRQAATK